MLNFLTLTILVKYDLKSTIVSFFSFNRKFLIFSKLKWLHTCKLIYKCAKYKCMYI